MSKQVTDAYLLGIKEGRELFNFEKENNLESNPQGHIDSLTTVLKGYNRNSTLGQTLVGEIDFWKNQLKINRAS